MGNGSVHRWLQGNIREPEEPEERPEFAERLEQALAENQKGQERIDWLENQLEELRRWTDAEVATNSGKSAEEVNQLYYMLSAIVYNSQVDKT